MRIILYTFKSWFRVRGHLVAPLVFFLIMFIVEGSFWGAVSSPTGGLSHYSRSELLFYIFAALTTSQINSVIGEPDQLSGRIESGELETYLVRPQPLLIQLSLIQIGSTLARLLFLLPLLIGLHLVFKGPISVVSIAIFIPFVLLTSLLNFLINFSLSSLTFFFRDAYAFVVFKETLWWILSGSLIPLDLFPVGIREWLEWMPSAFVVYQPVKVLMDGHADILQVLSVGVLWTLVASGIAWASWNTGVRRYQAYGS